MNLEYFQGVKLCKNIDRIEELAEILEHVYQKVLSVVADEAVVAYV